MAYDQMRADQVNTSVLYKCSATYQSDDAQACQIGDSVARRLLPQNLTAPSLLNACIIDPVGADYQPSPQAYIAGCAMFSQAYYSQ